MRACVAFGFVASLVLLNADCACAQSGGDVVGTWAFVSSINEQNGRKTETYGPGATGMMTLDAQGRYSLMIIGANLPKYTSNSRLAGTAEEYKAIASRSNAHFGMYIVDPQKMTITFKIESATFPNWKARSRRARSHSGMMYWNMRWRHQGLAEVQW